MEQQVAKRLDLSWKGQWDIVVSEVVEDGRVVFYVGVAGFNTDEENNTDLFESFGDTFEEAITAGEEVAALHVQEYLEEGKELPSNKYTGKITADQTKVVDDVYLYGLFETEEADIK